MTSVNSEAPPVQNQIHLKTSNPTSDAFDPDSAYEDEPLKMDRSHNPFSEELNNGTDNLPGMNVSNDDNANLEANTSGINRNLFSETPLGNGSNVTHGLEYLVSSTEENKEISSETSFDSPPLTPNRNGDVLFESTDDDDDGTKTVAISCQPGESLGLVLGMNEIIDASEGEVRKVYVKKVSTKGAINQAMKESNSVRLGDEVLAINGTYIKTLSRTECLNLLTDLPTEITLLLLRNRLPWTSGPRCSFYLNLVDKNPESILSPAPKLFTNEGKKIPDGYKLLEVSLYREESDLLGISIVPSYGNTKHYYQIKELESEGICSKSKLLNKSDCLVSCNGNSLYKIPFNQCLNILKSEGPSLTFEVFRKDDNQAVLESHETQPVDDVSSEVNNNNNNNNNNSNNNNDDDDGRSANSFTSELLISTEVKPTENTNPFLETSEQENLLDFSDTSHSDSKTSPDTSGSPDTSKSHLSSLECEVKNTLSQPLLDFLTGSPFIESKENISLDGLQKPINPAEPSLPSVVDEPCIELTSEAEEHSLKTNLPNQLDIVPTGNPFIETTESVSLDGLQKPINPAEPVPSELDEPSIKLTTEAVEHNFKAELPSEVDIVPTGSSFIESTKSVSFEELQKPIESSLPSVVDEPSIKLTTEAVEHSVKTNLSSHLDIVPTGNPFIKSTESVSLDELQKSIDPAEPSLLSVVDEPCVELTSESVEHNLKTDLPSQLDIVSTGNPFKETTESVSLDGLQKPINPAELSEPCIELTTEAVEHSVKTNLSSHLDIVPTGNPFIKSTESVSLDELQKPINPVEPSLPSAIDEPSIQLTTEAVEHNLKTELPSEVDIVPTGSSFIESTKSVSFEDLQKPIKSSLPSVVDEPCSQLTTEAVESSPHTDWSSELNMSKQSPAKDPFSLDGLEEFSNTVINDPSELNNNLDTVYPSSSNEDLISIDTDILSPINSNPTLIFSNHTDPWEAAGEAKSEHVVPDFQISHSTKPKNPLNEFIDTVDSPDYGLDPLDGLQENIMQVARDDKCLSSRPTNFVTDNTKGINLVPSGNVSLDNDLVEEERTSPISYDDSLSGSTGIQTADEEGDIPLSSRNSDNDLIDEMQALSPDSGRADSPGVYKNNSYYQDKFNRKEIISKLPPPGISDDHDKLTDDETTIYHTISDTSRKNKSSEKHGSFDSCDSCGTSVGSFESCAETGELDPFSTNSKQMTNRNKDLNLTRSLPRNVFSNFQEYKTGTFKSPSDARFISSNGKRDLNDINKSEYLNKFSTNFFGHYKRERDQVRSEDKPFQVEVLKGIIGLGMTLKVDDQGFMKVTHIQNNSPIGRNGIIKVGDYILSINNTDIVGESYSRVQQILRLLPRGLIKVVASAVPMSDWKKYTEDAEKPLLGNSGTSHVTVSLTSPIKMSDSFSLSSSSRGPKSATESKSSLSFSSALNIFSKDPYTDSAQPLAPSVPSIPTSLHKNGKPETFVKSSAFLNSAKQSPPPDKKHKYNSYDHSPLSSPEVVLNQVRMFESFQNNNSSPEIRESVISSKQKLVEMSEPGNQKQFPEKDRKEALPDILQDHTNTTKKFGDEFKNGTAKTIGRNYNTVNKTNFSENGNSIEDIIVPLNYHKFSALPKSSAPRILDSFSLWDSMDSIAMQNQNKGSQIRKKTVSQVSSVPRDAVKEEVIIPKIKTSVQSLVNKFNFSQDSNSSGFDSGSSVSKVYKATNEKAATELLKQAVMEESIEPIRKARLTNMSKPLPISFSDIYDIDEVLIIERTEKKNSKPDLKMILTGPYSAAVEVSEPLLKPDKKSEVKAMKRPVAQPRTSYILNASKMPKKDIPVSDVDFTEREVSIGIARRLSQSAIPDCIDIMKVPEVVPTENVFSYLEETIIPQVRTNKLQAYIESPRTKRAKAISLMGSMDDDRNYKRSSAPTQKLEPNRTEINEDLIISCLKDTLSMSARSRKIDNVEDLIAPVIKKSKTSPARTYTQYEENINQSSSGYSPKCSLNVAEKKAEGIVKDIIDAAHKELCQTNKNPNMVICDITGHTPCDEDFHLSTVTRRETPSKSDALMDNFSQIVEPELKAEMRPRKLSTSKRNLPLLENGKPKPLPRQSRQMSPSAEKKTVEKTVHRSLPSPKLKSENLPSTLETNTESQGSARLVCPAPFQRSVSPGRLRNLNERDSTRKIKFFSAPSSPMQDPKPSFFKETSTSCLESLLNSELQNYTSGRVLPPTPGHNFSRCRSSSSVEEHKFAGRSLPTVPLRSSALSSVYGHQTKSRCKTWQNQPVLSQATSMKIVSPSVQLQESPLNMSASLKMTKSPEFSSPVELPLHQQVTNQLETKVKVPETKTEYLVTNSFDNKVEKPSSPMFLRKSPISWTEHQQTEHQVPFTMKSSLTFSPTIKAQELSDAPDNTSSLSASGLKYETPSFFKDPVSSTSPSRDVETRQTPLPAKVTDLPEVKVEISTQSSPLKTKVPNSDVIDGLSMSTMTSPYRPLSPVSSPKRPLSPVSSPKRPLSPVSSPKRPLSPVSSPHKPLSPVASPKRPLSPVSSPYRPLSPVSLPKRLHSPVSSPKRPLSPVSSPHKPLSPVSSPKRPLSPMTKPPEYKTETLTLSSPIKIVSSSPVVSKVSEIIPVLASPVRPVSLFKDVTETQASSPSGSPSTFHLETTHNDSAPASPNSVSPRRFGRKLPDIFQGSHISVSSPIKFKSLSGASSPSESFSIENTVSEQKAHKIKEVSNAEVALSRSISVEPKIASELRDSKLKSHGVEIIQSPQAGIAVSHPINIEPIRASTLTEVTAEKPGMQVREEVSKPEVAVSQFIGIKPTTATDLSEKKVTTPTKSVVEEIAKPKVAVSQFIGIKPTTVSDLSGVKELKTNTVELSKPDNEPMPSVKKQEQNIEIFAGIPSPKSEVAVSKFIGVKPTTATKLSESVKSSPVSDAPKSPEKQSPSSRAKLVSSSRAHSVTSPDFGQRSLPRSISMQYVSPLARNSKSVNEENLSSSQGEKIGIIRSRRVERPRPKSEIASIFSKRKWCISTKSGQTNFAVPSEPETVDSVIQLGIIDEDDLSRLLTSANMALDKMLFSNNEEIHIAILEKEASEKIGIKLKKGEKQELVISLLEPDGAAIKQKCIYIGDSLLLVNGKPAWNQTVMDVKMMLQTIETRIILVLCRHPMDDEEAANDCEYLDVILRKGVTGVGFCLEGGVGCPLGDRPISVKRIFKGGPAEKGGQLMVGDEILKVNEMDFQKHRHFVAWNHLKFLPEGDVKLHICRRKSQAASTKAAKLQAVDDDSTVNTSA